MKNTKPADNGTTTGGSSTVTAAPKSEVTPPQPPTDLITAKEAGEHYPPSPRTFKSWITKKLLPTHGKNKSRANLISVAEVEKLLTEKNTEFTPYKEPSNLKDSTPKKPVREPEKKKGDEARGRGQSRRKKKHPTPRLTPPKNRQERRALSAHIRDSWNLSPLEERVKLLREFCQEHQRETSISI